MCGSPAQDPTGHDLPRGGAPVGPLLLLTDRVQARDRLPAVVAAAVREGVRAVVLRERDLPWPARAGLALALHRVLAPVSGLLLLAGPPPGQGRDGVDVPIDGCHLAGRDPWPDGARGLLGRSCHAPEGLVAAAGAGARYATLSPVFRSTSKPGYGPALGPSALRGPFPLPVYALGGVEDPPRARACVEAGAAGIAVMGAVMRAEDPRAVTAALLRAVTA